MISSTLLRLLFPVRMLTRDTATPKCSAIALTTAAFALPSVGGSCTATKKLP